jgi:hypothetical protein
LALLTPVVAALALASPAPAGAYLYWTAAGEGANVARADLNGAEVDAKFIANPYEHEREHSWPRVIAVGDSHIYFGTVTGLIGRASLLGGGVVPDLISIPQPSLESPFADAMVGVSSLAVSDGYVYWCSGDGDLSSPDRDSIGRASVDGGDIQPNFIQTDEPVYVVRVDAGHIYWASNAGIGRASITGAAVEPNFLPNPDINSFAVAEGHIFWTSEHAIGRAGLGGQGVNPRFIAGLAETSLAHVDDVAVGAGHIYWNTRTGHSGNQREEALANAQPVWIGHANIDGSNVNQHFINVTDESAGTLAIDALGPGGYRKPTVGHRRPKRR